MFVSPTNNVESENNDVKIVLISENIDKDKSILGTPPKLDKKKTKNPRANKGNTTVFVSPTNNVESKNNDVKIVLINENIDKGKSILGTPPEFNKNETKNPRANKGNTQKSKQKKQHICHHCGATRHTRPNCYKWFSYSIEQHFDLIGKLESVSILFCSS